jgi:hypothetical protein
MKNVYRSVAVDISLSPPAVAGPTGTCGAASYWEVPFDVNLSPGSEEVRLA